MGIFLRCLAPKGLLVPGTVGLTGLPRRCTLRLVMSTLAYLDYAATTPLDPRVRAAVDAAGALVGNPSSVHRPGREARVAIDCARVNVARLLGVSESGVVFTSGATEANGAALAGVVKAVRATHADVVPHIVASSFEHASLVETIETLFESGSARATFVDPNRDGIVPAEAIAAAITPDTVVVTVMWVNNVLGTVQPVAAIGEAVVAERARRGVHGLPIVFLCDAVQAMSSTVVSPVVARTDILTLSAHKMYGPKGVGAMCVAPGTPFSPVVGGGGQENGRRHGTENVAGIVGFGEAARILLAEREKEIAHTQSLRQALLHELSESIPRVQQVGADGAPGIIFLRVSGVRGDELALKLDAAGFAVSAGSACDAGTRRAPRALSAVLDEQSALYGGIRVSFGRFTSEDDLRRFVAVLSTILK